jgi:hypothetical protein
MGKRVKKKAVHTGVVSEEPNVNFHYDRNDFFVWLFH